jgi:DNA-binding CsgD family transcriptional regulator
LIARLVGEIELVGRRGLTRDEYFHEVGARVRRVVDSDAMCWHTLDPETRIMTSDASQELVEHGVFTSGNVTTAGAGIVASEYVRDDVNRFAELAAKRVPVGILSQATRGRPERSARYREVLAPAGIPFELRAAFVSRGRCWGAVHCARRADKGDFTDRDAKALASVTAAIAEGIRSAVRFDAARRPDDPLAPGLVVLGPADDVELITPPARELLADLRSPGAPDTDQTPPSALLALAAYTRRRPTDPGTQPAVVAVPGSHCWITLHASLPEGPSRGRVAIVIERSSTPRATALRLEAHGVTAREREVATLLAQGLSNTEIATKLVLSPFTVQDHIKSLYEKTGVTSRQELVARIFLDDYVPHLTTHTPLTSAGGFNSGAPPTRKPVRDRLGALASVRE